MLQNTQLVNRSVLRYTNALYGVENDENKKNKIFDEIKKIINILDNNENFTLILKSPILNRSQQIEIASNIFSIKDKQKIIVSESLFGLIMLLAKNSKLFILEDVFKKYIELHNSKENELEVIVSSVKKISEDVKNQLKKSFSKNGKMNVNIVNIVDKALLGGLIIQIGSNLIDTSIKTKLNKIKSAMKGAN